MSQQKSMTMFIYFPSSANLNLQNMGEMANQQKGSNKKSNRKKVACYKFTITIIHT